jgi:hypothetical protein
MEPFSLWVSIALETRVGEVSMWPVVGIEKERTDDNIVWLV